MNGRGHLGAVAWRLAACLMAAAPAAAQPGPPAPGQPPRPASAAPKPAAPAADAAAFEAARTGFEVLPEAERKALQDALVWTGDYNSVVNGAFGRRSFEALNAYRTRTKLAGEPLEPRNRSAILAAGEAARKAARFTAIADAATGVSIGVPEKLLSKRSPVPGGTRWQSADGRVTLETRAAKSGEATLDALYDKAVAPQPGRNVTYKLKRPDFFVVTGETASGRFYIRQAAAAEGVRGFTIAYDKALAPELDRLVIAIANSFAPFADPATVSSETIVAKLKPDPMPSRLPSPAGTGLTVAPGRVLTAASVIEGCPAPQVRGATARVAATEAASGLALLEAPGLAGAAPAIRLAPIAPGDDLVAVAADSGGLSVAAGSGGASGGILAPLQPGAAGAPVLDRFGGLAGLVGRFPAAPRLVAGVAPPTSHPVVTAQAVAAFLAANGIAAPSAGAGKPGTVGSVAAGIGGAVVAIVCRR